MEKNVLVLDNYDSFTFNLVHYIESFEGVNVDVFRNDEIALAEIDNYDAIVLSPGPGLPKDAGILKALIEEYFTQKKILGVCLGMQAIGEVFGGQLENIHPVLHGVATSMQVLDEKDALFKNLPKKFNVGRYHSWVISSKHFPKELIITAKDENNQIMALRHYKYPIYGVQFHPESILSEYGKELIGNFLNVKA